MKNATPFLPMFGIHQQHLHRGGIGAAYLRICSTGLLDAAVTLFRVCADAWRARPQDQAYLNDLEKLFPATLAQTVQARLRGITDLSDPGLDPDEQRKRLATIHAIRAKTMGRAGRDAVQNAERTVAESVAQLQQSLGQAFATGPEKVRRVADQVRRGLQELAFPPADPEPLAKLQHCLKSYDQINARRSALAGGTFEFVSTQLRNQAHRMYERTIGFLAAELAEDALRQALPKLAAHLDELGGRSTDFAGRMTAALTALERRQKKTAQDQQVSRASVVMPLDGPDEKQILAGMIERHGCADLNQLSVRILEALEAHVRRLAPTVCPHLDANTACLADLVRAMEPDGLAASFLHVVEESLGTGHTIYEVIARRGLDEVADFLSRRASPTCHLGNRDIEAFNISPLQLTIVRLPPAVGTRDPHIRESLCAALAKYAPCTFADGAPSERSVTVVRVHVGWPIGIAEDNRPLLERYLRSGRSGHLPHLIGVVPDAPLGTVSPATKDLIAERQS